MGQSAERLRNVIKSKYLKERRKSHKVSSWCSKVAIKIEIRREHSKESFVEKQITLEANKPAEVIK